MKLPWEEIIDRLYRRQEVGFIFNDLKKRGIIKSDDKEPLTLINGMKEKVESYRLKV
jgi:hypothetical protein